MFLLKNVNNENYLDVKQGIANLGTESKFKKLFNCKFLTSKFYKLQQTRRPIATCGYHVGQNCII